MADTSKITPKAFALGTRKMVEDVVAPVAKQRKAKTLNQKVEDDLFKKREEPDVKVVLDNLKEIGEWDSRAIPLKEVYDTSESMALDAARAAARSSKAGVLDKKSARFLPFEFQAEFEKLTGVKIDDKPGAAVKGVKITMKGNDAKIDINFAQALEGTTAKKVILGLTQQAAIIAERVSPPADPNIPAYWIYISARPGKAADDTWLKRDNAMSGFSSDSGSLISAGKTKIELVDQSGDVVRGKLEFSLDAVNDIGSEVKAPSAKTKVVREAWIKRFDAESNAFDFKKGVTAMTRQQFEALPGAKTLLSAIREDMNTSVSRLVQDERLEFVRDPKTSSAAALVSADGEAESWLYVLDEKARKWVGTWDIGDDGTKDWEER